MNVPARTPGLALRCDAAGMITEIISDDLEVGARITIGQSFASFVGGAADRAEDFLAALRTRKAAFNWELDVTEADGRTTPWHFAGSVIEDNLLIVGARSRAGVAHIHQELLEINNEQANALRAALKDLSLHTRAARPDRDTYLYEELSRLNNDLATAQRELAKKNAELGRLNDLKNQFLGIAAHDLRNPLEVILAYSDFLLNEADTKLDAQQVGFIHKINSSSEFMLALVNDLLDISRIEAGRLELDLSPIDVAALVSRNVSLNRVLAAKKEIDISLEHDESVGRMMLDAPKIEQVLNNLIGNAIKFSPPGSRVEVKLARFDGRMIISVTDEGPGISPEELEKLFRPFERGRAQSTAGEKSTGLGLAIVKRIIEGHGGDIRVESATGKGAVFSVSLPLNSQ
jgi:signal transduction histidine kinase